jgi:hypothetical protein
MNHDGIIARVPSNEGMETKEKNSIYKIFGYHYGASEDSCLLQYGAM